jgi:hypothetical protein
MLGFQQQKILLLLLKLLTFAFFRSEMRTQLQSMAEWHIPDLITLHLLLITTQIRFQPEPGQS